MCHTAELDMMNEIELKPLFTTIKNSNLRYYIPTNGLF